MVDASAGVATARSVGGDQLQEAGGAGGVQEGGRAVVERTLTGRRVTEPGEDRGCAKRVADQLGYGVESVRAWVRQADIDDGLTGGVSTDESERVKALEQENRELRRANSILKSASAFFAAELDRPQR